MGKRTTKPGKKPEIQAISPNHPSPLPEPATTEPDPSEAAAENAFRKVEAQLLAIPRERIRTPKVNVRESAKVALGVHRLMSRPDLLVRLQAQASIKEFDILHYARLDQVCWAEFHIHRQLAMAQATASSAKLPADLVKEAEEVRTRMRRCVTYFLDDVPQVVARLTAIASGNGYDDLADDNLALAEIYQEHRKALAVDPKNYRPGDEKRARQIGTQIQELLATSDKATQVARWKDLERRAWTLILEDYEELSWFGRLFYRRDDPDSKFPSLVTAVRAAPSPTPQESPEEDPPKPEPGNPTEGSPTT
jgi:hypothetical protein